VFVSHNLAVVRQLCEYVVVLYLGRVAEAGPTQSLFRAPRHPYTRMLLDAVPRLDPERARVVAGAVRGETPSAIDRPAGCAFNGRCPEAQERCATQCPEAEAAGESHQVACLRWRELEK
jgi:oligopeptide/dipeptide ABC transporter ATP-binding protein